MKLINLISFVLLTGLFFTFTHTPEVQTAAAGKQLVKPVLRSVSSLSAKEKAAFIAHLKATGDCEWNGIKLYGKVQFVDAFPDIKIQFVEAFADLDVQFVDAFPDACGKWQVVESFPDFKVQVVEAFPDLKIRTVNAFPGM